MDKNAIKKYAVWARRELISRVSQKALQYGISEKETVPASAASVNGVVLSAEEIKQRKALIDQINAKGYEQVMEEVAYTWFNRFIALRFMEVNGYLPSHIRVFTDEDNAFRPQIITEAINLELDGLDMDKVYAWKDANDNDSLFKYLIITQCNALSPILPRMFQRIADYTELLFPDNLLREGSVIERMIEDIQEADWTEQVEVLGWLYQYYNSEKKDEVFAALKKNVKITKENIPAATQLFTPDWIVRYMVENSLGRLWIDGHPNDSLKSQWKYYLDEAEQGPSVQAQLSSICKEYASMSPEQIKCIDPCAGSGHILAYMFDVLVQIYEDYGYSVREAVRNIIDHNLFGLDIDDRAAQLAYFTVMMKARQYDKRFLVRKNEEGLPDVPQPNVCAICESNGINRSALKYFGWSMTDGERNTAFSQLIDLLDLMENAKEYGSILNIKPYNWELLYRYVGTVDYSGQLDFDAGNLDETQTMLWNLVNVAAIMEQKYDAVITNPPYMGSGGMSNNLAKFTRENYPDTKADLFACFIDKGCRMTTQYGYNCMVTMQSWMFLSTFENMRDHILRNRTITNLMHMENMVLGIAFGTAVSIFRNMICDGYIGTYNHVALKDIVNGEPCDFPVGGNRFAQVSIDKFSQIPGQPIAYWVSDNFVKAYGAKKLSDYGFARSGLQTGNNELYLKLWYEVARDNIAFGMHNKDEYILSRKKWTPQIKGGSFRKWYGNFDYVVNWENDGAAIRSCDGCRLNALANDELFFKEGITWSHTTSGGFGARYLPTGHLFNVEAPTYFTNNDMLNYVLGMLNSKISQHYLNAINSTVHYLVGNISSLPIWMDEAKQKVVGEYVKQNVSLEKADWDAFETSWDFAEHPMIRLSKDLWDATAIGASMHYYYGCHPKVCGPLELCYMLWQGECQERFKQLKENEEELNRMFIDIYGLQDELTPDVEDKDVTVRLADKKRDIKSLISYAVGCMFGRYSLDVPGLAYAGGEWDDSKYVTFHADKDSIIPICDDEYFADDIVGRFIRFIEVVYGKDTLNENLRFIADALGGSGQPKDVIRNYFLNDFYADHCATYQVTGAGKRPIYWLFDSGKKNGFKALVYMHRYAPDTIARMRTDYVHEQQARYRTAIADLEQRIASASTAERVKLSKRLKTLQEQATEIQGYEEKIHHLADQYISIDLDDGVKKNYAIFGDVLAKIK